MGNSDFDPASRTILAVDDEENILQVLEARLDSAGYRVITARSGEHALEILGETRVDLIISDVKMPGMGGQGLMRRVQVDWPLVPVILLTAFGSIPDAVASVKDGAADYVTKPFDGKDLLAKIAAILSSRPAMDPDSGKEPEDGDQTWPELASVLWGGQSPAMDKLYAMIAKVAPADVNVLLTGESGTGKELIARILHQRSTRADKSFMVVDCGSTPEGLLESELFGHVKGSFTHALKDKRGLIQEADGGTLFLDEIGNISHEMQTRLLRFLQERTIRRIGETREIRVSCRVIAATNADLQAMVRDGAFREDLYFRLKVVAMAVPPLRERAEDVPLLAERFVEAACRDMGRDLVRISPEAMRRMRTYAWPGNVRELKNALEAGIVLCSGGVLRPDDLQLEEDALPGREGANKGGDDPISLEHSERQTIIRALEKTGWVQKNAADLLGISRRAIHYKIKKYGIEIPGRGGG